MILDFVLNKPLRYRCVIIRQRGSCQIRRIKEAARFGRRYIEFRVLRQVVTQRRRPSAAGANHIEIRHFQQLMITHCRSFGKFKFQWLARMQLLSVATSMRFSVAVMQFMLKNPIQIYCFLKKGPVTNDIHTSRVTQKRRDKLQKSL